MKSRYVIAADGEENKRIETQDNNTKQEQFNVIAPVSYLFQDPAYLVTGRTE